MKRVALSRVPPDMTAEPAPVSPVEFQADYGLTERELVSHYTAHRLPSPVRDIFRRLLVVLGLVSFGASRLVPTAEESDGFIFLGILMGVGGLLLMVLALPVARGAVRKWLRANPRLLEPRLLRFDEAGLADSTDLPLASWSDPSLTFSQDEAAFYIHLRGLHTPQLLPRRALTLEAPQAFARLSGAALRPAPRGLLRRLALG